MNRFGTVSGRRRLLDRLESIKRDEGRVRVRRNDAISRSGIDRVHRTDSHDILVGYDDKAAALVRERNALEQVICEANAIAPAPKITDPMRVQIDTIVTLRDPSGGERVLQIGGHGETDLSLSPPVIAYDQPGAKELMRELEGATVTIGRKDMIIDKVSVPDDEVPDEARLRA